MKEKSKENYAMDYGLLDLLFDFLLGNE